MWRPLDTIQIILKVNEIVGTLIKEFLKVLGYGNGMKLI